MDCWGIFSEILEGRSKECKKRFEMIKRRGYNQFLAFRAEFSLVTERNKRNDFWPFRFHFIFTFSFSIT